MVRGTSGRPAITLILVFLTSLALPLTIADGSNPPVISVDWLDHDDDGVADHAYMIGFDSTTNAANFYVNVSHSDINASTLGEWNYRWDDANFTISPLNLTHHRITIPTNLSFGDEIIIER